MTGAGEPSEPRRRRELSDEERALWRGIARSVRPLRRHARREAEEAKHAAAEPSAPTAPKTKAKTKAHKDNALAPAPARVAKPPAPPPLAGLVRREKQQLARGRAAIEARIDLHGMTQAQAHLALARFLRRAQADGAKFVLVITGKGARAGDAGRGVLRRQVPLWLGLPDLRDAVVGFEEAHFAHGGEGALYVRLRRPRPER
jgi:DNA-nicking Smr family endonuclease